MSDVNTLASAFLKQSESRSVPKRSEPINSFRGMFGHLDLEPGEREHLQDLLVSNVRSIPEKKEDFAALCKLTAEVRSIQKQGVLLIGERVHGARAILRKYKDRSFSKWLDRVFGSRKTAYNALSFFELYRELPTDELKQQLKNMPTKASYVLASREGGIETKKEIIEKFGSEKPAALIAAIQEHLPLAKEDKRTVGVTEKIASLKRAVQALSDIADDINYKQWKEIAEIFDSLDGCIA